MGLLTPQYVDLAAMTNTQLRAELAAADRRAHNPLRTHGSHVRNLARLRAASTELAHRISGGRA